MFESYFFAAFVICLIIGLPTFFTGCGTNIPNTCFAYDQTVGTVYNYKITSQVCSECVKRDNKKKCTQTSYYTCYDGYVKIHFANNQTCLYEAYNDQKSFTDTQNKLSYYYPKGMTDHLFLYKADHSQCTLNDDGLQGLTYTGITFLSLGGVCLVASFSIHLSSKLARRVSFTEKSTELEVV